MPDFVYSIPRETLAVYFSSAAAIVMFLGLVFVKPFLRLLVGGDGTTNETIGLATAGFSLFYGLLLGLLTVAAYESRERIQLSILNEASAVGSIYSTISAYPEPYRSDLKELLRDYTQFTIKRDWPAHKAGRVADGGNNRIQAFGLWLSQFEPKTISQQLTHEAAITAFQDLKSARQMRLNGVTTRIPPVLWYAVMVGAGVSLLLLLLIRARPIMHFVLGTISAFFLGVILFVIVSLDAPLQGDDGLSAEPYERLWDQQMAWDEPRV